MDPGIIKTLQQEWQAVSAAPWSVFTIGAIALAIGFGIATLYYSGTISTLRERVQFFQDRLQGVSPSQVQQTVDSIKTAEAAAKKPLIMVQGKFYRSERVILDGYHYDHCTFENVTFVYNGGPGQFSFNTMKGFTLASDKPEINSAFKMLFDLGLLKVQMFNDGGMITPSNPLKLE